MVLKFMTAALLAILSVAKAAACDADTDCALGERTYRIALPPGEGPFGAIVFMHGYRGTAAGEMANAAIRALVDELGVALIAPQSGDLDWLIRNAPRKGLQDDSRELAYFDALLDDVTRRYPIDPRRILAAGFSAGGMMTWTLACHRAERFAGFLPISGTFWAPIPAACPNPPVNLIQIHGTADTVVPLAGRAIADTRQGDVRDALALFAAAGGYHPVADTGLTPPGGLACEAQENDDGKRLALCLHAGGHTIAADWLRFGYEALVPPR